jgi:hypothetical protein
MQLFKSPFGGSNVRLPMGFAPTSIIKDSFTSSFFLIS